MKRRAAILAVAVALLAPAVAHAGRPVCTFSPPPPTPTSTFQSLALVNVPFISVCVNGQTQYFTDFLYNGKQWLMPTTTVSLGRNQQGQEASYSFSAFLDPDPSSAFTFGSVLPSGFGSLSFDAYFSTPVVPGSYNTAASSAGVSVTATGAATGGASAGTYPFYISGLGDATNLGVDAGTGACTSSAPPSPTSVVCGPYGTTNTGPPMPISPTFLTAHLSYTHSTSGTGTTTVGWTGAVDLTATAVPEPATLGLVFGGLLLTGVVVRRRR